MTTRTRATAAVALACFLATIPLANITVERYGFVDVPWLGAIPAGTVWIGLAFVARDVAQLLAGRAAVMCAIAAGAVLSAVLAAPALAWASLAAFVVSEALDMAVYTPLAARGRFAPAVAASSLLGGALDSWLFLRIAFGADVAATNWWRLAAAKAIVVLAVTPVVALWRHRAVPGHV